MRRILWCIISLCLILLSLALLLRFHDDADPFPLRSKTWFPTWKGCCPCLPNMPWTNSNRMKRKRRKKRMAKRKTPRKPTSMRPIRAIPSNRTPNREKSSAARSRKATRREKSLGTGWMQTTLPSCSRRPSRYMS